MHTGSDYRGEGNPRSVIALLAARHTGYLFMCELLNMHPDITVVSPDSPEWKPAGWAVAEHGSREWGADLILEPHALRRAIGRLNVDTEVLCLAGHTHYDWLTCLIDAKAIDKVVVPLRHPRRMLESHYVRGEAAQPAMGRYMKALHYLRSPDAFAICVDTTKTDATRLEALTDVFVNDLRVSEPTDGLAGFIRAWPKVNHHEPRRDLTDAERQMIERRLRQSNVYTQLRELGLYYAP